MDPFAISPQGALCQTSPRHSQRGFYVLCTHVRGIRPFFFIIQSSFRFPFDIQFSIFIFPIPWFRQAA
jgi:hypothetical protein